MLLWCPLGIPPWLFCCTRVFSIPQEYNSIRYRCVWHQYSNLDEVYLPKLGEVCYHGQTHTYMGDMQMWALRTSVPASVSYVNNPLHGRTDEVDAVEPSTRNISWCHPQNIEWPLWSATYSLVNYCYTMYVIQTSESIKPDARLIELSKYKLQSYCYYPFAGSN